MSTVGALLQSNPNLELFADNRVRCKVTGHELPLRHEIILAHVNGPKYKKALHWYSFDYKEFEPYIVQHKGNPNKMYCLVTRQTLNRIPDEIKKHMSGKRFCRLLIEYKSKQLKFNKKKEVKDQEKEDGAEFWMPEEKDDDPIESNNEDASSDNDEVFDKNKIGEDNKQEDNDDEIVNTENHVEIKKRKRNKDEEDDGDIVIKHVAVNGKRKKDRKSKNV